MIKIIFSIFLLIIIQLKSFASDKICIEIDWQTSHDSNLSAKQKNQRESFATVNERPIYFSTVPYTETRKDSNSALSSRSEGCFDEDILLLKGNTIKLQIAWPVDDVQPTGSGSTRVFISKNGSNIPLCEKTFGEGYPKTQTCIVTKILNLQEIDPERAAKLKNIEAIKSLLSNANSTYGELKNLLARLEEKFNEISGKSFDELSESTFAGYENELADSINAIRNAKKSISELKTQAEEAIRQVKEKSDQIRSSIESELKRTGSDLNIVDNIDVPHIDDIDVKIPEKPEGEDPFDPANNPYDKLASALTEEVSQSYPDRRYDILTIVNSWLKKKEEMDIAIQVRATISPKEVSAYQASVSKVYDFLLKSGCGGQGCFTSDWWFKDSVVPSEVRRSLKAELRVIDPVKSELIEEQMRLWQRDEINQKKIIAAVQALAGAARALGKVAADDSAYLRGRLDAVLSGALTAAKNGVCLAGSMAPGVNDFGDWYETVIGKDLCRGDELSVWERALSGVGIIVGSGKIWRAIGNEISGVEKVARRADDIVEEGKNVAHIRWGMWSDLQKRTVDSKEYAVIGERLYTQHAIERMTPSGFGSALGRGTGSLGRGVPTVVVEHVLQSGTRTKVETTAAGIIRETWKIETVEVVTEKSKEIVVTVMRKGG